MPIETGALIQAWMRDNSQSLVRDRDATRTLDLAIPVSTAQTYTNADGSTRAEVMDAFNTLVQAVPATDEEIQVKVGAANELLSNLHIRVDKDGNPNADDVRKVNDFIGDDLTQAIDDVRNNRNTPAAAEALKLMRGLIGLKIQATEEMRAFMGRTGPQTAQLERNLSIIEYRDMYDEPVEWKGRGDEPRLISKIGNILLVEGVESPDVKGFISLLEAKASATGNVGDYVKAFINLVGKEREPGALQKILSIGTRSGVDIKGVDSTIESLTPENIVALANLALTVKVNGGEKRVIRVGDVLEALLTIEKGRRAWTDPHWTGNVDGASPYLQWLGSDSKALKDAWKGMDLDPGWYVYPDGAKRPAGPMDNGGTYVRDIQPVNDSTLAAKDRQEQLMFALMDSKAVATLYVAARALGILTQPIPRLYGARGIMEALPAIQKIWGTLYEDYYNNQSPFYRKRGFVSLMAMVDRAVKSPLSTIYPLPADRKTMDGFAFAEKRPQEIAKGGIVVDRDAVVAAIQARHRANGETVDGQTLKLETNRELNKIDALLLNLFGCAIDDPGNFNQEYAVAQVVGAVNDTLISATCEPIQNPLTIKDGAGNIDNTATTSLRRKVAIARAQDYFRNQVETALSYTDDRARSMDNLFKYVKYVHVPPEMIRRRLNLIPDEYKDLLNFVDFNGLLKRWKGIDPDDNASYKGLGAAKDAVDAMGAGVMATLPGGTTDLNSPFLQKQGGYWANEYEAYNNFVKGYPLALQVLDDDAQKKAGIRVTVADETKERTYELMNEAVSALRGVTANEKIRGTAVDEYLKWVDETAPKLTFIGGKAPVITFYHIACTVAAGMVGYRFVPPYLDKEQLCYVVDGGKRLHAPLGVNDTPAEYGDLYKVLPDDILALVGIEKDVTGKALMSPGRITSMPVIGMEMGYYDYKKNPADLNEKAVRYDTVRGSNYKYNPSEYAGSKQVFPQKPEEAYAIMARATLMRLFDKGLVDLSETDAILKGLAIVPSGETSKRILRGL